MEPELENVPRLQRTLRDVIAVTALPAVWAGADARQISVDVSDVVFRARDLDLAYLADRLHLTAGGHRDFGDAVADRIATLTPARPAVLHR